MRFLFVFGPLLFSNFLFAATQDASASLSIREKALIETKTHGATAASCASDAQVSGMLQLKDPRPEVVTRRWNYFMTLSGQTYQAEGRAVKQDLTTFDLSKNDTTFMPSVEFGLLSREFQHSHLSTHWGLRFKAGLASEAYDIPLNSGLRVEARLNTSLLSTGPLVLLNFPNWPKTSFSLSPQLGTITYTQTSTNDFVAFSKSGAFVALGLGVQYQLSSSWGLLAEWTQRSITGNNEISLQKDNLELGTRIIW